jgi:hypothetical protein
MAERPTHSAYVVEDAPQGSERKAKWREVGAIWPHKNGRGFDLVLFSQLAVSGRIICVERREDTPEAPPHE